MSKATWSIDRRPLRGLYRDRENGWIFGVCAGFAEYFGLRVAAIRLIALVSLLLFFWPAVVAYLLLTLLIREKPLIYSGPEAEYEFWRRESCRRWSRQ